MLDSFDHIKAYWIAADAAHRPGQLARFGADDIDGTVIEEKIYHDSRRHNRGVYLARRSGTPDPRSRSRTRGTRHPLSPRGPFQDALRSPVSQKSLRRDIFHHRLTAAVYVA